MPRHRTPRVTSVSGLLVVTLLALTSCGREPEQPRERPPETPSRDLARENSADATAPVSPPAPGTPGGLPDDRTPLSEAPFSPTSAQGAGNVLQTYYALVSEGHYNDAWKLWTQGGEGSGMSAEAFAASFAQYSSYNANIGKPGEIEGAAGSLFVSVPVVIFGRKKSGEEVHELGEVTLRRVNDVPGSTADERAWHIFRIDLKPSPGPAL